MGEVAKRSLSCVKKGNRRRIPRALILTRIKAEIRQEADMLRGVDLA
jgi:hypothetical protein